MSQAASKKKLKQAVLPFCTSSLKKRKREDDLTDEEETKSRRISGPTYNLILPPKDLNDLSVNEASLPENDGECSLEQSSKVEAVDSNMDVEVSIEQISVSDVPNEVCDKVELRVPSVDTSPLNTSQLSKDSNNETECESSSERNSQAVLSKKLTPKRILKKQEAEAKRLEREKVKQEKEKEKLEKKEAKEKKRLAEIEARNEEKRLKEEKRKLKEEERKLKEEELRRQKEAEKKAKEEEKQKKLEEIRMKEEQEKEKKGKEAAHFKKFFLSMSKTNVPKVSTEKCSNSANSLFLRFEVKENMKLAPETRASLTTERREHLEMILRNSEPNKHDTYLTHLKSDNYKPGRSENTWPLNDDDDPKDDNVQRTQYRCKLLQFSENRRPAYWGTWRKRSRNVTGKTPFKCDSELEYDVDSDEEWVEEPGESLHGSDDEKESDHEYEVDNEVFVPHGYLSDDEANDENPTNKLDLLKTEFEAELKEKTFKLKSRSYGCTWIANTVRKGTDEVEELLLYFRGVFNVNLTPFGWQPEAENASTGSTPSTQSSKIKSTTFPEEYMPDFIKLAHGNKISSKNLGVEFCAFILKEVGLDLSRVCVKRKLKGIGFWDNSKHLWYIRDEVRQQYGLEELSCGENKSTYGLSKKNMKTANAIEKSPTTPTVSQSPLSTTPRHTSITKYVKVLTPEERKNQLRMTEIEKKGESPKNVTSPQTSLTKFLVRPKESSVVQEPQPIKKRAALFTKDKGGSWILTSSSTSSTSVISTAVTSSSGSITSIPPLSENQVTTVNPVVKTMSSINVEIDGKTSTTETSEAVENEPPVELETNEFDQDSTATVCDEDEERRKKLSNVTVKEGRKYATLIPIKKTKGENS